MSNANDHAVALPAEPLQKAEEWMKAGTEVAVATVIETWGSSPRQTGSQLVIAEDGRFEGSVSGGCVEADVIAEAMYVIQSGEPKTLTFGVSNETAWKSGLTCGGQIRIYVERVG
ncbi:MAG: XdhC family protein [Pseudomonadota bacterium]